MNHSRRVVPLNSDPRVEKTKEVKANNTGLTVVNTDNKTRTHNQENVCYQNTTPHQSYPDFLKNNS